LAEHGFSGLTLERICSNAKIPKATFYRRWTSPRELVSTAFNERFEEGLLHNTGDVEADLRTFARVLIDLYNDDLLGRCLLFIVTESKVHSEVAALFTGAQGERRRHNVEALALAFSTQGIKPSLTPQAILNVLNGVAFNMFAAGRPMPLETFDTLIAVLLRPLPSMTNPPT
jgi:AcrR family transcriptional regulator